MNTPTFDHRRDAAFDAAMRAHHALAVQHLSARVRTQLAQRRHAVMSGETGRAPPHHRWWLPPLPRATAGFAAIVGALAIGLHLLRPAGMSPAPQAQAPTALIPSDATTPSTPLDEDPEFYTWLASTDARQIPLE